MILESKRVRSKKQEISPPLAKHISCFLLSNFLASNKRLPSLGEGLGMGFSSLGRGLGRGFHFISYISHVPFVHWLCTIRTLPMYHSYIAYVRNETYFLTKLKEVICHYRLLLDE